MRSSVDDCTQWAQDTTVIQPFTPVQDPTAMRQKLEAGEFDALGELQAALDSDVTFSDIVLTRCPSCDGLHVMTLRNIKLITDKEGKVERKETPVVQNMLIDAESHQLIQDLHPGQPAAATDQPQDSLLDHESLNSSPENITESQEKTE